MNNVKRFIKAITMVCAVAVMALTPVNVKGADTPIIDWQMEFYRLQAEYEARINELQLEILSLNNQLQNQANTPAPTPRPSTPNVKLLSPQTVTVAPGEEHTAELTLRNIGTSSASGVLTQASPSADSPFTVEFLNGSNNAGSIGENSTKTMQLKIIVDEDAKPGTYSITLNHSYKNRNAENITGSDTLYVRIPGSSQQTPPNILLKDFRLSKAVLAPGDTFVLYAVIENIGANAANAVQVTFDNLDAETLYPTDSSSASYYNKVEAGYSGQAGYNFSVAPRARTGAYPVNMKVTYYDAAGEAYENKYTYYVNIVAGSSESRAVVEINGLKSPSGVAGVGQDVIFTLPLRNVGTAAAGNIRVTAAPSDEKAIVPKSSNPQSVSGLPVNGSRELTFTFSPTEDAKTQAYTVGFRVEYETGRDNADGTPEVFTFEQYGSVNVSNPEDDGDEERVSKPKMIIAEYSVDPIIVNAGREFEVAFTFQNASLDKTVSNIKITLVAPESTQKRSAVFTPVGGSNTFYIDEIGPKATVQRTLRMYTAPDADPSTYSIDVYFEYDSEDAVDLKENERISINVKQVTRLETSEPYIPEMVPLQQKIYLDFSVINTGRVSLSNLRVRIEGDFDTKDADMHIGNLGKGNQIYYHGELLAITPGEQHGTIIVYGEDDAGDIVETSRPFTVNVFEMDMEMGMGMGMGGDVFISDGRFGPGMEGPMEEQGFFGKALDFIKKPYFWGPAAGVIALIVVIIIMRVRRKKNRIDFDE